MCGFLGSRSPLPMKSHVIVFVWALSQASAVPMFHAPGCFFFFTVNVQLFFLMPYKLQIMTRRNHLKNKLETSVCGCNIRSINLPLQECSKCHKSLSSVSRFHEIVFITLLRLKRFLEIRSIHITIG